MKRSRWVQLVGAAAAAMAVGFAACAVAAPSDDQKLHLATTPADFAAIARHRAHPEEPYKGPYEAQPGIVVLQTRGLQHGRNHGREI